MSMMIEVDSVRQQLKTDLDHSNAHFSPLLYLKLELKSTISWYRLSSNAITENGIVMHEG
jgi:hypothetical protein